MPKDVLMPALELAQETGRVLQWVKADGDAVTQGEILVEIETDKVTVELEAEASGYLRDICAGPGDEVPVGSVIARIWSEEEIKGAAASGPLPALDPSAFHVMLSSVSASAEDVHDSSASKNSKVATNLRGSESDLAEGETPSSPKTRSLPAERGLGSTTVTGATGQSVQPAKSGGTKSESRWEREMSRTWRIMADRLTAAWNSIPHFYLTREVDATHLLLRKESAPQGTKISISDLLVQEVARCLQKHPRLNTHWHSGEPEVASEINIGLAVALEDGLIVPVIHRADQIPLGKLAEARTDIVRRAKSGTLRPEDLSGGTFTISNLGMYGVDSFQAIVNPPQAAILAVARIRDEVIPVEGKPSLRPVMTLTLSCDHRLVDGVRGAKFLIDLVNALEAPLAAGVDENSTKPKIKQ